jgi:hypothetical protein
MEDNFLEPVELTDLELSEVAGGWANECGCGCGGGLSVDIDVDVSICL